MTPKQQGRAPCTARSLRAACRILSLSVVLSASVLARAETARPHARIQAAHGVTPGGLVYQVNPASRRLVLRTTLGTQVGSFLMRPEEHLVAGVADDGSRVTVAFRGEAPSDDGMTEGRPARYAFRDSTGNITAIHRVALQSSSFPVVFGTEVYSIAREKDAYFLLRTSASAPGARMGRIDASNLARDIGQLHRIVVHASAAGLIVEFVGAVTSLYFDPAGAGRFVRPDTAFWCGRESHDQIFPTAAGVGRFTSRFESAAGGFQKKGDLEWLDGEGNLVRETNLGEIRELFPLPSGQLLALDDVEARVLDDRGNVLSRVPFSEKEGVDPVRAGRASAAARRIERLGSEASGADWAEAALAANGDAGRFSEVARRDPSGVLNRLVQELDASPQIDAARIVLASFLASRGFESRGDLDAHSASAAQTNQRRWVEVIRSIENLVLGGVPRWFRTQASFAVLTMRQERSPGWATLAAAEAISSGETTGVSSLPDEAFTPELAELTLALDRDRMDRLQRENPELTGDFLLSGSSLDSDRDTESLRFHVPPQRFAAELLSCLPGSGPLRFQAVVEALGPLGVEGREGSLVPLLLQASHSADADLRAGAQVLFPLYGIGIDEGAWRRDVLRRGDLLVPAASLQLDESLTSAAFTALFSETILKARSASRDPQACALKVIGAESADDEAGEREDPYCRLLASAIRYGRMLSEEADTGSEPGRSREIGAWTRSSSAPPEIRLQARIARARYGNASDGELLELWSQRDLPWSVRTIAFASAHLSKPFPDLVSAWSRELRLAKSSPAEESAILSALRLVDPAEAARIALERWEYGEIAPGEAGVWVRSLDPARIASDPKLRAKLMKLLNDDGVGSSIASVLARAGAVEALPPLMHAIRAGLTWFRKEELVELFSNVGAAGAAALEELCRTLPVRNGLAVALAALFESEPARAAEIAQDRLERSLQARCVPASLVTLLAEKGLDPYAAVARRLVELRCDRRGLKPTEPLVPKDQHAIDLARNAAETLSSVECRQAFEELFGIGQRTVKTTPQSHSLRVFMAQLRQKLEDDSARPKYLTTEPGVGYRLKID